jgi:hypothetical protein
VYTLSLAKTEELPQPFKQRLAARLRDGVHAIANALAAESQPVMLVGQRKTGSGNKLRCQRQALLLVTGGRNRIVPPPDADGHVLLHFVQQVELAANKC